MARQPKHTVASRKFKAWVDESQVRSELAAKLEVTTAAISTWTLGLYTPRQRQLLMIQELAGIPRAEWFEELS